MTIVSAVPFTLQNGTIADATQVMADFNSIKNDVNANAAANGANNDITSLSGLTTPLSVAQGGTGSATTGGGGLVLLTSGTVTNAATLDIVMTAYTAYRGIKFFLSGFRPATDGAGLLMRFSTDGGATYIASGYNYALNDGDDTLAVSQDGSSSTNAIVPASSIGNGATEGVDTEITMLNQSATTLWTKVMFNSYFIDATATPRGHYTIGGGSQETAQDTDAVRFLFSSGNIAAGNYAVYGLV